MTIRLFTAAQIIDPDTGAGYRLNSTNNNYRYLHTHEYFELHCVTKGTIRHSFADGTSHLLPPGSLLLIRPADEHVFLPSGEEVCEYINIAYSTDTVEELFRFLGAGFRPDRLLQAKYPPTHILADSERLKVLRGFERILALPFRQKELIRAQLRSLLAEWLLRAFPADPFEEATAAPRWLLDVYDDMNRKEHFVAGTERMVELSGRSRHHLCREFKKHFRMTPTDYVNGLRLNCAANLLAGGRLSVTDIALELNFHNLSHFHHLFKRQFGVSPGKYRQDRRLPG